MATNSTKHSQWHIYKNNTAWQRHRTHWQQHITPWLNSGHTGWVERASPSGCGGIRSYEVLIHARRTVHSGRHMQVAGKKNSQSRVLHTTPEGQDLQVRRDSSRRHTGTVFHKTGTAASMYYYSHLTRFKCFFAPTEVATAYLPWLN